MFIRLSSILALIIIIALAGCSGDRDSKPKAEDVENRNVSKTQANPKEKTDTEAEAKEVLKKALDSWAFGDSKEKFKQDHPDIHFGDLNRASRKKLASYEIGNSRKVGKAFQFLVTLTLANENGKGITLNGDYTVLHSDEKWVILGGAPPQP